MTEPTFATLKAQCAQAGVTLVKGKDWSGKPCYLACRYGQCRELPTLQAVAGWLAWTHPRAING